MLQATHSPKMEYRSVLSPGMHRNALDPGFRDYADQQMQLAAPKWRNLWEDLHPALEPGTACLEAPWDQGNYFCILQTGQQGAESTP
jgi:hypothetical protein